MTYHGDEKNKKPETDCVVDESFNLKCIQSISILLSIPSVKFVRLIDAKEKENQALTLALIHIKIYLMTVQNINLLCM